MTDNISLGRTARNTAGGTGPPAGHRTGGSACTKVHLHSDNPLQKKKSILILVLVQQR